MNGEIQEELVREWECSGKTAREWCRNRGLNYQRFLRWRKKHHSRIEGESRAQDNARKWTRVALTSEDGEPKASGTDPVIRIARGGWIIGIPARAQTGHIEKVLRAVKSCC